jgi:alpha/beta superfamily hydrolase
LTQIVCPWLVIQGDQDEVVPFLDVKKWAENPPSPLDFVVMRDVGHFFHKRLIELRDIIVNRLGIV